MDEVAATVTIKAPANMGASFREYLDARGLHEGDDLRMAIPFVRARRDEIRIMTYGPESLRVVIVPHVCPHFTADRKCDLHETNKPEACKQYPTVKDDLSLVPECSYKMEPVHA